YRIGARQHSAAAVLLQSVKLLRNREGDPEMPGTVHWHIWDVNSAFGSRLRPVVGAFKGKVRQLSRIVTARSLEHHHRANRPTRRRPGEAAVLHASPAISLRGRRRRAW